MELLSTPARLLVDAVAALRAQVPVELPGDQALAETAVLLREAEKLHAVVLARVADVDVRRLHELDGAPSTSTWVSRQQTGLNRGAVALARRFARYPHLTGAVADGEVSVAGAERTAAALETCRRHVDRLHGLIDGHPAQQVLDTVVVEGVLFQLCEAAGGVADDDPALGPLVAELTGIAGRDDTELGRLEAAFLLLAQRIEPALLGQALTRLVDAVLPQQLSDRAEQTHRDRGFALVLLPDGSGYQAKGVVDLELGELLHTAIAAGSATDPAGPDDTAAWAVLRREDEAGAGAGAGSVAGAGTAVGAGTAADDASRAAPRSRKQQAHDALLLVLRRALDSGVLGTRGKATPHLLITVGLDALQARPGARPAVGAFGTSLPLGLVQQLTCDATLTRMVLGLGRRVLETSHSERTLKAHERRALHVQFGGRCAGSGCLSPPGTPLHPHHVEAWSRSGTTSFWHTVPLCPTTHHDVHHGHTVRLRDGRLLSAGGWVQPATAA